MAKRIVNVLIPVALDQAYSYRVPDPMELSPGDIVRVPLGAARIHRCGVGRQPKSQSAARQSA